VARTDAAKRRIATWYRWPAVSFSTNGDSPLGTCNRRWLTSWPQRPAQSLYRVLRLLAGVGLLTEVALRRFALRRLGAGLQSDVPGSPAPLARVVLHKFKWEPWGHLLQNVQTGQTGFEQVHGMGLFRYLKQNAEEGGLFDAAIPKTRRVTVLSLQITTISRTSAHSPMLEAVRGS
jgi:hypothetical protein